MALIKEKVFLVTRLLKLAEKFNCFYLCDDKLKSTKPFYIAGKQVGLIRQDILNILSRYPEVFHIYKDSVLLNPAFRDYAERSVKVENVLMDCREKNLFITLKGWRDECYEIRSLFNSEPIMKMDRSATCLFGICQYGVDITGYIKHPDKGLCIWLQRRSKTKQTWPGKWDNMVGGGLSVGFSVLETAYKEAEEEANIPKSYLENHLIPAGSVSFFFESERGLFPNTEFVYDLELPLDFIPENKDGEVDKFDLLTIQEIIDMLLSPEFKTTSCPVLVDFLIRHGVVSPDNEPQYPRLVELLHVPLQTLYGKQQCIAADAYLSLVTKHNGEMNCSENGAQLL